MADVTVLGNDFHALPRKYKDMGDGTFAEVVSGSGGSAASSGVIGLNAFGYQAWNMSPWMGSAQAATHPVGSGVLYLQRIELPNTLPAVTNMVIGVQNAGVTLTSGQNFLGLYNSAGALLGTSSDQSVLWASTGSRVTPFAGGPIAVPGGTNQFGWLGFLFNGTTAPGWGGAANSTSGNGILNQGLTAATAWSGSIGSGFTTALPPSFTPSGIAFQLRNAFIALS